MATTRSGRSSGSRTRPMAVPPMIATGQRRRPRSRYRRRLRPQRESHVECRDRGSGSLSPPRESRSQGRQAPATNAAPNSAGRWRRAGHGLGGATSQSTSRGRVEKVQPCFRNVEPDLQGPPEPAARDDPCPALAQDSRQGGVRDNRRSVDGPDRLAPGVLAWTEPTRFEVADQNTRTAARCEEVDEQGSASSLLADPARSPRIGRNRHRVRPRRWLAGHAFEAPGAISSSRLPAWFRYVVPSNSFRGWGSSTCSSTLPSRRMYATG